MSRLLIVDGHAYAYRAFYAIRSARGITMRRPVAQADGTIPLAELRSPAGEPTNAIFGFVKMLAKMRAGILWPSPPSTPLSPAHLGEGGGREGGEGQKQPPTHLIVVWDGGLSAERTAALPGYKAQRPAMPAELGTQIDDIVGYLAAAGVASFCRDGVEADDYIACLARRAGHAGMAVVIASADKDFMQLVSPEDKVQSPESRVQSPQPWDSGLGTPDSGLQTRDCGHIGLLNPHDKTETVWTAEQVRNKAGVGPSQIVDWLALVGDSVDNIPGVPGVGPKTAAELLNQFGSVTALYRRLDEVKSEKLRAALAASADDVRRNVELVRLKDDLPCEFSAEALAVKPADAGRLGELFGHWGFRTMLAELQASRQTVLI